MSLIEKLFGKKQNTAHVARDRLKLVLATERAANSLPYMDDMRREIMEVVKKYTQVKDIVISTEKNQNIDVLEMDIVLR